MVAMNNKKIDASMYVHTSSISIKEIGQFFRNYSSYMDKLEACVGPVKLV